MPMDSLQALGVEVSLGTLVLSVDSHCNVTTQTRRERFDAVVIATGTLPARPAFTGARKPGVFVLDSRLPCELLREATARMRNVVVVGSETDSFVLADRLSEACPSVTHLPEVESPLNLFSDGVREMIRGAGSGRGVRFVQSPPREVAGGLERTEAVVAGDRVIACDAVVVIPRRLPRAPASSARTGTSGGLAVDRNLQTSIPSTYAAGGCAEYPWAPRTCLPSIGR